MASTLSSSGSAASLPASTRITGSSTGPLASSQPSTTLPGVAPPAQTTAPAISKAMDVEMLPKTMKNGYKRSSLFKSKPKAAPFPMISTPQPVIMPATLSMAPLVTPALPVHNTSLTMRAGQTHGKNVPVLSTITTKAVTKTISTPSAVQAVQAPRLQRASEATVTAVSGTTTSASKASVVPSINTSIHCSITPSIKTITSSTVHNPSPVSSTTSSSSPTPSAPITATSTKTKVTVIKAAFSSCADESEYELSSDDNDDDDDDNGIPSFLKKEMGYKNKFDDDHRILFHRKKEL
ncbi:hypothetical protein BGZ81_004406, partial [Podila clonocystis]